MRDNRLITVPAGVTLDPTELRLFLIKLVDAIDRKLEVKNIDIQQIPETAAKEYSQEEMQAVLTYLREKEIQDVLI